MIKNKKFHFSFYAFVGSEHSQIQQFISDDTIIDNKENIYIKSIIPKIHQQGFKVAINIKEYYFQLIPFKYAICFVNKDDVQNFGKHQINKPINIFYIITLLFLLDYIYIKIVVDSDQGDILQSVKDIIDSEKIKYGIKQFDLEYCFNFNISELISNNIIVDDYLNTDILILNKINEQTFEVVITNGTLLKGSNIYIGKDNFIIQQITLFNKEVELALKNQIVIITFDKICQNKNNLIGSSQNNYQNEITIQIEKVFIKDHKGIINSFYDTQQLDFYCNLNTINQKVKLKQQVQLYHKQHLIICFSLFRPEIVFYGKVLPQQIQKIDTYLIPYKFVYNFTDESQDKFISKCRLCKQHQINTVLIPCGHLRYCIVCAGDIKECYYCNTQITEKIQINIQECDSKLKKSLLNMKLNSQFVIYSKQQQIPYQIKIEYQNFNNNQNYKCKLCQSELISKIILQNDGHCFICYKCEINKNSYEIQYCLPGF